MLINFYLPSSKIGNVQVLSSRPKSSLGRYFHLLEHRCNHPTVTSVKSPGLYLMISSTISVHTSYLISYSLPLYSNPLLLPHRHTYLTYLNRWLYFVTGMFQKLITFGINGVNLTLFQLKLGSLMLRPVLVLLKQQACRRYIWTPNSSRNFQTGFTNVNDANRIFLRLLRRREKTLGLEASCQQH